MLWPDRGSKPRSTAFEPSMPTITPPMRFEKINLMVWQYYYTLAFLVPCYSKIIFSTQWLSTGRGFPPPIKRYNWNIVESDLNYIKQINKQYSKITLSMCLWMTWLWYPPLWPPDFKVRLAQSTVYLPF